MALLPSMCRFACACLPAAGFTRFKNSSIIEFAMACFARLNSSSTANRSGICSCMDKNGGRVSTMVAENESIGGFVHQNCDFLPATLEVFMDRLWFDLCAASGKRGSTDDKSGSLCALPS